jgi:hypothetical protein
VVGAEVRVVVGRSVAGDVDDSDFVEDDPVDPHPTSVSDAAKARVLTIEVICTLHTRTSDRSG